MPCLGCSQRPEQRAAAGGAVQALMQAVEVEVTTRLGVPEEAIKFSRQHLANSLWAMATLELLPSGRLLAAVADAMKERASDCNPQEISNTVWAFAKLGERKGRKRLCCLTLATLSGLLPSWVREKKKIDCVIWH